LYARNKTQIPPQAVLSESVLYLSPVIADSSAFVAVISLFGFAARKLAPLLLIIVVVRRSLSRCATQVAPALMSSYFSITEVLADEERVPCRWNVEAPGVGYLDPSSGREVRVDAGNDVRRRSSSLGKAF
jgi:hypothetical protein